MAHKWYQSRMNQAAMITGLFLIAAVILPRIVDYRKQTSSNETIDYSDRQTPFMKRMKDSNMQVRNNSHSRLWITYAHEDDRFGDFTYLVQELETVGINAAYDKIALIPGRDLWTQLGEEITEGLYDGWAYLITPTSLSSESCREELSYALNRALKSKGRAYPLIGLLHGVKVNDLPPSLRVRLNVSLSSPTWTEEVLAALEGHPPRTEIAPQSQFVWNIHSNYGGNKNRTAIEIRPRFGEIMYWRIAIPVSTQLFGRGYGPSDGGQISSVLTSFVEGEATLNNNAVKWFGSGDRLSPSISAYVIIEGELPKQVFFGISISPFGFPDKWELLTLQ